MNRSVPMKLGALLTCVLAAGCGDWDLDMELPLCGDGKLTLDGDKPEACDGNKFANFKDGSTCESLGFTKGKLECDTSCGVVNTCSKCGDNLITGSEECDGTLLGDSTCKDKGFENGTLSCSKDKCSLDTTGCWTCGDTEEGGTVMKVSGLEVCDGDNLKANTCLQAKYAEGTPTCADNCLSVDNSSCWTCGDGQITGKEVCDGKAIKKSLTCNGQDKAFLSGTLTCDSKCLKVSTDNCSPYKYTGALNYGSSAKDQFLDVAVTASGDRAATGFISGNLTLNGSHTLSGTNDVIVARWDSTGALLWSRRFGDAGSGINKGTAVAMDSKGDVIIAGEFRKTIDFDGTKQKGYSTKPWGTLFVVWLDKKDGKVLKAIQAGGKAAFTVWDIALDSADNVYITGRYLQGGPAPLEEAEFGTHKLKSAGHGSTFVAKVDEKSKDFSWAKRIDAAESGEVRAGQAIEVDSTKKIVYVAGVFNTAFTHDKISYTPQGSAAASDIYVAALNASDGATQWLTQAGGPEADYVWSMGLSKAGAPLIGGIFRKTATFPGLTSPAAKGYVDAFVASLDTSGKFNWVETIGNKESNTSLRDIAVDASGNVHIVGGFVGSLTLGKNQFTNLDAKFFGLLDTNSAPRTFKGGILGGGHIEDHFEALALDTGNKYLHAAGYIKLGGKYGELPPLKTAGNYEDLLVVKLKY